MAGNSNGDSELDTFDEQLAEVRRHLREREKMRRLLDRTKAALEEETLRLSGLEAACEHEHRDVRRLEGFSIQALYYEVTGEKGRRLKREREQLLAARLKADESLATVNELDLETSRLEGRLADLGDLEAEFHNALQEKEQSIAAQGHPMAERLADTDARIADLTADRAEANEAIAAGEAALAALYQLADKLKSAQNWGSFDILGGGLIATAVKHSRLDEAAKRAHRARQSLAEFQRELNDVEELATSDLQVDVSDSLRFADAFFDGFIFDLAVQSRIDKSKRAVDETTDGVEANLEQLDERLKALHLRYQDLMEERQRLIETA